MSDRNDGNQNGTHWSLTIPLSTHATSPNAPTVVAQLSLALQQGLHFRSCYQYLTVHTLHQTAGKMLDVK